MCVGLCDAHLAEQCVGGSFEGATWSANGSCVGCWSEVDASDSWLLSSGHRACQGCAATVAAELRWVEDDPALRCLACDCLLQRPLHLGLDGRGYCPGCRKRLVSATTSARRTVLRLVLLWLKACSRSCPRIVGAARVGVCTCRWEGGWFWPACRHSLRPRIWHGRPSCRFLWLRSAQCLAVLQYFRLAAWCVA